MSSKIVYFCQQWVVIVVIVRLYFPGPPVTGQVLFMILGILMRAVAFLVYLN